MRKSTSELVSRAVAASTFHWQAQFLLDGDFRQRQSGEKQGHVNHPSNIVERGAGLSVLE